MNIVMAFLALSFLVFIHELGHYWAARATGIRVEEFAIGFGPAIFKIRRNDINYRFNWIPLGGYVRMLGEDNPNAAQAPDSFNNRPIWARFITISAGVIMNYLGAVVILSILFNLYGTPTGTYKLWIGEVVQNSPAASVGLHAGDVLVDINGKKVDTINTFLSEIRSHANQPIELTVLRDNKEQKFSVTPKSTDSGYPQIGVRPDGQEIYDTSGNVFSNTNAAINRTNYLLYMTFDGFRQLVTGQVSVKDLSGPVEIVRLTGQASSAGVAPFLNVIALLSLNLAVLNILPFPALDGGRLVFLIIEAIRRGKRISLEKEASINFIGILFLFALMIVVTFKDVLNLFSNK